MLTCLRPSSAVIAILLSASFVAVAGPGFTGAIFSTTSDGTAVNENTQYDVKEDVYLSGGPGETASPRSVSLPEGDYYFQVTDPSGQDLLSTDHISCRRFHVSADGVITLAYAGTTYAKVKGEWAAQSCQHSTGVDLYDADVGGVTVQVAPYDDTPNPGGMYRLWVTPVSAYTGNTSLVCSGKASCVVNGESWTSGNYHGFSPSMSKTDNFKVRRSGRPYVSPLLTVRKFHDADADSVWDADETEVIDWVAFLTDPLGVTNSLLTPAILATPLAGAYAVEEDSPAGTAQTAALLDGLVDSAWPAADPVVTFTVAGTSGETHTVTYGNVGLGSIDACKVFDRDGDGLWGDDESTIPGWEFTLTGVNVRGELVGPVLGVADETGCALFDGLLPGNYTVVESTPTSGDWEATSAAVQSATVVSTVNGAIIAGTNSVLIFTNILYASADFGTKGYWHNTNGQAELTEADRDHVNGLDPYAQPSSYFESGDEPFDGQWTSGSCVEDCSWGAEISTYLVDSNASGDRHEQLAQQLLAFIFNTRHRLGDGGVMVEMPEGSLVAAGDLIQQAIDAWLLGDHDQMVEYIGLLDAFNNNDAVIFVPMEPGVVEF